ncbi:MAG: shikimate dehydrogenase [Alphaproteobacteria bacterium]|nr:MAG: shikimate dehydrogenase [Alphaproteobacteria bacterium]
MTSAIGPRHATPPIAGVIGWPIAHSLSPALHRFWLQAAGIAGDYVPLAVRPDRLAEALAGLAPLGLRGVNVTIPHKEACVRLVDRLDPLARRVGAVNLIRLDDRGRLEGRNSDVAGVQGALAEEAPDFTCEGACALLLGAGGAARAVAVALLDAGIARLVIVNRHEARARRLAEELADRRAGAGLWQERSARLKETDLLINATSLGMTGQPRLDLELSLMPAHGIVFDLVYRPLETPLLYEARRRGLTTIDGLAMLVHQAVPAFEAFFGRHPEDTVGARRHLAELIGGKSPEPAR